MKILAKSALRGTQPKARQDLDVEGIELIFLGGEIEQYAQTREQLLEVAENFSVLGLEAPGEEQGKVISPLSENCSIRQGSQDYLFRCVELINEIHHKTHKEAYFQYRHSFENFDAFGKPSRKYVREELLRKASEFHQYAQQNSEVPLQVENGTPICIRG